MDWYFNWQGLLWNQLALIFAFTETLKIFYWRKIEADSFSNNIRGHPAVKDTVEALVVPHVEVDLILRNDQPVDFTYHIQAKDKIKIYPARYPIKLKHQTWVSVSQEGPVGNRFSFRKTG